MPARLLPLLLVPLIAAVAPDAPRGLARDALARKGLSWTVRRAPGLRVYFLEGSHPARSADRLARAVSEARRHDLALLGGGADGRAIDVFFVESRPQIESLVGMRCTGYAEVSSRSVFLMENAEWRSFERHELMHVLAHARWGTPAEPSGWIEEGWAQHADGACGCCGVDTVFAAMAREKPLIPLERLVRSFRELPDLDAYLEATSLVGYIHRRFGLSAVRAIWTRGPDSVPKVLGISWAALERDWRASLPRAPGRPSPAELARIRAKGCG